MCTTKIKPANKRGSARLAAVQAAYQMELVELSSLEVVKEYELYHLNKEIDGHQYREADLQWFRKLVLGVVEQQTIIDPILRNYLPENWPLSRIDSLLRAILRAGVWELKNCLELAPPIIINEYMDITKAFYDNDELKLVNGLLNKVAINIRSTS